MTVRHVEGLPWSRVFVGLLALAFVSPLPWVLGEWMRLTGAPVMVLVVVLTVTAFPMGRWAAGSWTRAALVGAVANLLWSYSLFADPQAAGPWLGVFLLVPYLAFTVAGCIGVLREAHPRRWVAAVLPPALYLLPFVLAHIVSKMRGVY